MTTASAHLRSHRGTSRNAKTRCRLRDISRSSANAYPVAPAHHPTVVLSRSYQGDSAANSVTWPRTVGTRRKVELDTGRAGAIGLPEPLRRPGIRVLSTI